MEIRNLAISMTNRCNAACKMCCFSCTPQSNLKLDAQMVKDYIRQASELGTFQTIAFTGGEAILMYEDLLECIRYARSLGFPSTLVTNGFWAANERKGYEMIKALADAGLAQVSMSLDKFHQEYVSVKTATSALKILRSLGLLSAVTLLDVLDSSSVRLTMERFRPYLYGVDMIVYPLFPAGAAVDHIADDQIIKLCEPDNCACPFDFSVTVLFDGKMMMCCSQFSNQIGAVQLGEFGKTTLAEAIAALKNNDYIYVMLANGFKWYADLARAYGMTLAPRYSVSCHLCRDLFTDQAFMEHIKPLVEAESTRLKLAKLLGR